MNRRHALLVAGGGLGGLLSGCVGDSFGPEGSWKPAGETSTVDCDDTSRPLPPGSDDDPPGDAERYSYPNRPWSPSAEAVRSYVERYERAYRLNKVRDRHGSHLRYANVHIEDTNGYDAPEGTAIAQVRYTYDAEIEGDDGPIEIDSESIYASYFVNDTALFRAVNKEHLENTSELLEDPVESGQIVECF